MSNRYGSLTGITSHYGTPSLGVLGSVIRANTATGLYGAGLLYNDWQDASDNTRELRALVTAYSTPAAPVVNEDGSIESWAVPADGTHTVTYQLYVDGVATGAPVTASVLVGAATGINVTVTGTAPHAGAYSAAAAVAAPSAGIGVTVAATVTHAGAFSASAVVTTPAVGGALSDVEQRLMFGWVQDLARIHGLIDGVPLVVTPTQRQAGPINQSINEAGSTVTVTRVP